MAAWAAVMKGSLRTASAARCRPTGLVLASAPVLAAAQQAMAMFMDSHERPQDPRFTGSVAETRKKYHDEPTSMYGLTANGHVLGGR